jgi:hypothetical protein
MVVSFLQKPASMRLRSHDPRRISLLTDLSCHDMVTREGCSGRDVSTLNVPGLVASLQCTIGSLRTGPLAR